MNRLSPEVVRVARQILKADFVEMIAGGKLPVVKGRKENITAAARELARYVLEQADEH